jgi:hypothetical protein
MTNMKYQAISKNLLTESTHIWKSEQPKFQILDSHVQVESVPRFSDNVYSVTYNISHFNRIGNATLQSQTV